MKNLVRYAKTIHHGLYACLALSLTSFTPLAVAQDCQRQHWVAAWQASPSDASVPLAFIRLGASQTFREVFSPLGRGDVMRLRLSNRFGKQSLRIAAITIARQTNGAAIDARSLTPVLFNGHSSVVIPAKQDRVSDELSFNFNSLEKLSVSIAVTGLTAPPTEHYDGREYSFITEPDAGNHVNDLRGTAFTQKTTLRHVLIGMDALAPATTSAVVTLGDSITDGAENGQAPVGDNVRYPDALKRRIDDAGLPMFVSNAGIGGNRVASHGLLPLFGTAATERYTKDVLQQDGVSDVILLEGINDIGQDFFLFLDYQNRFQKIVDGYVLLITEMQRQGIQVAQGTLTPAGNSPVFSYSGLTAKQLRQDINWWIRNKSPANVIVDFDAAVRDPHDPEVISKQYDTGDGLHFNGAGYARMAAAVDLSKLKGSACH